MRRTIFRSSLLCSLAMLAVLLACCGGGKPSRFYTLHPVSAGTVKNPASPGARPCIGIVSVEVPDYVDRPQIVTRSADNGLEVNEFDRWAGDLRNDVARVLAETMSAQLPGEDVFVLTGRRALPADFRVSVNLTRFDPTPGKEVWLRALWTVLGKGGREVTMRGESSFTEPIQGTDHSATVAAMSRAVARLGVEISNAVKPVIARSAETPQG